MSGTGDLVVPTVNLLSSPQSLLKYSLRVQSTILCTLMPRPSLSLTVKSDHLGLLYQLLYVSTLASCDGPCEYLPG
jgi:hypothetical protein